jgi:hypothetical protein
VYYFYSDSSLVWNGDELLCNKIKRKAKEYLMNARVGEVLRECEFDHVPGSDGVLRGETPESLDEAVHRAVSEVQSDHDDNVPQGDSVVTRYTPSVNLAKKELMSLI